MQQFDDVTKHGIENALDTIVGAIMGGGDVFEAAGSFIGAELGKSLGDALGDLGQNGVAFVVLWGCGRAVGIGCQEWGLYDLVNFFNGAGWIMGGATVAARVVLDLGLNEFFPAREQKEQEQREQAPPSRVPSAPPEMEMGLWVKESYGGGGLFLLPDLPRHQVLKMAKITAAEYFGGRVKKNFSKQFLGRAWGDNLSKAKEQLAALGNIELGGNQTYTFTDNGIEWLERAVTER